MSKSSLFVVAYSFVLIGLFSTCCYLMTTVDPAPMKHDRTRKFGSDDFLYPNDFLLPNDNVAFGLEKVADDYDVNDEDQKVRSIKLSPVFKFTPEIPRTTKYTKGASKTPQNKGQQTNYTRKSDNDIIKSVTKEIKVPLRGLRRSIKQNNEQNIYMDSPQTIILQINHDDRKRIEIKVISEKIKAEESSVPNNNVNIDNFAFDNENNTLIKLEENDTLIINVLNELTYENMKIESEDTNLDTGDSNFTNDLENIYTINLLKGKINEQYNAKKIRNETYEYSQKSTLSKNSITQFG